LGCQGREVYDYWQQLDIVFSSHNPHPKDSCIYGKCGSRGFCLKLEMLKNENTLISSLHFPSSTFIDFNNFSDEDVYLLVSSNANVSGSFLASILDV
jgi:hypothetical protein